MLRRFLTAVIENVIEHITTYHEPKTNYPLPAKSYHKDGEEEDETHV